MSRKKPRNKSTTVRPFAALATLFLLALVAYWNSFNVPFVFDDLATIQTNAAVRFGEFKWTFQATRAVLYLTFTLNHIWTGQEVWSYHLVNFLLHLLNGILVFILSGRLFRRVEDDPGRCRLYAGLAAAFFLVHPIQTESVTYISSRSELLSTCFYLIGFLIFVLWPEFRIGFLCSLAVAIPYLFGLGSKETVITLPAAIFLYDFLFLSGARIRPVISRWRFYSIFIVGASAATYYLMAFELQKSVGAHLAGNLSAWHYLLTQFRVIVRYVQLIIFPVGLNLDYDFKPSTSPFEPAVIASFLFLSGLIFLGWWLRRRNPVFSFSILWFFVTLSPTSSVVPIADVIFEHRLYLPLIGVCMSFPLLMDWVYLRLRRRLAVRGSPLAYSCLVLIAFIIGTIQRNYVWADEIRLFTDVVSKSPGKERTYNALAFAYYKRADYQHAIEALEKGRNRVPDKFIDFSDSLANLYLKVGRYDEGIEVFKQSLPHFSGSRLAVGYNNLGVAYLYMWNDLQTRRTQFASEELAARTEAVLKPAAEAFLKALELEPDMPWALDSYVNAMCYRGKGNEIETEALKRLAAHDDFEDLYTVGKVAFNRGDYARADEFFERAEKLAGKDAKILFFNHGYALTALKQDERAIPKYLQAIHQDPLFSEAYHNLGLIYMRKNDYGKAEEAFAEVLRRDPKHVNSNLNLATIYLSRGDTALARRYLATVLEASPGNPQAVAMLQQLGR